MPVYSVFMAIVVFGAIAAVRLEGLPDLLRLALLVVAVMAGGLLTRRKLRGLRMSGQEYDY